MKTADHAARVRALTDIGSSLLVEAGAGSGKTALLAGRVVFLLASGAEPRGIAAVTFTEMAASELMQRIDEMANAVIECGRGLRAMPMDLVPAFGDRPTAKQLEALEKAKPSFGEITCTTIHGFCQRLLKPYPVEAGIDPGARVLSAEEAALAFEDEFRGWIARRLSGTDPEQDILTVLASSHSDAKEGIEYIHGLAMALRANPGAWPEKAEADFAAWDRFIGAAREFDAWTDGLGYVAEGHREFVDAFLQAADTLSGIDRRKPHAAVAAVARMPVSPVYMKSDGGFRIYRLKGKWEAAAPDKKAGAAANEAAAEIYARCAEALAQVRSNAAAAGLSMAAEAIAPLLDDFRKRKRESAYLDFDDLLMLARDMLRGHPEVAKALGERYPHVLVDEFQDTDGVQTDIFKALSFTPDGKAPRPGAIFLVGDPKQAIYRFRGADVHAYLETRDLLLANDPESVVTVTTNFRSRRPILDYVNGVYEEPLSRDGQPGFSRLDAHRGDPAGCGVPVAAFHIPSSDVSSEQRDLEAEAVAKACGRLIGSFPVLDRKTGMLRPCAARDIALLAPTGTELWRYENALEDLGISVSTQAGKGMFQQQEVQDLIALTRVLADPKDTLALGALLRGPLVGLTEEELLDESAALPDEKEGKLSFIRIGMPTDAIRNPVLRATMAVLNDLHARSAEAAPHAVLGEAVEAMRVRPVLRLRKAASPERALANVDRYLEMSRPYAVRGLRAFSDDMRREWEEGGRMAEGRPDSQEDSVSLITMHSSKGLEWGVVIPVNTLTETMKASQTVVDVRRGRISRPFLGIIPDGYAEARAASEGEEECERVRLWYVACTRARDLLLLPRHEAVKDRCWAAIVNLKLGDLPSLDLSAYPGSRPEAPEEPCAQDTLTFDRQAAAMHGMRRPVRWRPPSRHEYTPLLDRGLSFDDVIDALPDTGPDPEPPAGGRERGEVLHKLMEEILTGETPREAAAVEARAAVLAGQRQAYAPEGVVLDPAELAATVMRTFSIPEVAALGWLEPEVAAYSSSHADGFEDVVAGVIDAVERLPDGSLGTVVDWKSDVQPSQAARDAYVKQVRDYLRVTGLPRALIVYMTLGKAVEVLA